MAAVVTREATGPPVTAEAVVLKEATDPLMTAEAVASKEVIGLLVTAEAGVVKEATGPPATAEAVAANAGSIAVGKTAVNAVMLPRATMRRLMATVPTGRARGVRAAPPRR